MNEEDEVREMADDEELSYEEAIDEARVRFLERQHERRQAWRKKNGWASQ